MPGKKTLTSPHFCKQSYKKQLGQRLRDARESTNLTQEDVAAEFEISQGSVSRYELGKADLTSHQLLLFSKLYRKPITFFYMDTV
ncbi:helix-turn-helix domain-containing protein [Chroococcidiopsis sp.]|uniref:helix-turn-helix domain-containing protein n=1 Tax=Chroococcidiopsis sp. TaxID=3088168 RepID=UPI003F31A061